MKYKTQRGDDYLEVKKITIKIGSDKYRITESVDGKLTINKLGGEDNINVHPRYANEIEIS